MSATEILLLLALIGYAIYRQTRRHEITGHGRFTDRTAPPNGGCWS